MQVRLEGRNSSMLVLSRQRDESIMIGDKVVVTIVDIRGDKVRLGIESPGRIPVHRQEVYEAIRRENRPGGRDRTRVQRAPPARQDLAPAPDGDPLRSCAVLPIVAASLASSLIATAGISLCRHYLAAE